MTMKPSGYISEASTRKMDLGLDTVVTVSQTRALDYLYTLPIYFGPEVEAALQELERLREENEALKLNAARHEALARAVMMDQTGAS
jgi:hypothetical protein